MNAENKEQFEKCIKALFAAFGQECTNATLSGYWMGLSDLPIEQVQKAVSSAIRTTKFVAKPFELRELTGTVVTDESRAQRAWLDVQRALRIGAYKSIDFDDKLCNAVIRGLGGWPNFVARFTSAKEEEFSRHAFTKAYRNFAASAVSSDSCRPLPGLSEVSFVGGVRVGPIRIACEPERVMLPCPVQEVAAEVKLIGELAK